MPPRRTDVPPLQARGISVRYGGLLAVDNVSIHADPGEIVGIMGTNGAGKTTLFDVLSGRSRPTAGSVYLYGQDITRRSPHRRARLGLGRTFQQAKLFDDLTVTEVVGLASRGGQRRRLANGSAHRPDLCQSTLETVGLLDHGEHYAAELSTGSRRLVELACVIALGAKVLLLDEPTAGFTLGEVDEFVGVLRDLRDSNGVTIVVIDHDVAMMSKLAERLYVMESGQVIAEGGPNVLHDDPRVLSAYIGATTAS
jgi:ABC-type branched-subunit amino acid transport system ATPase component